MCSCGFVYARACVCVSALTVGEEKEEEEGEEGDGDEGEEDDRDSGAR